MTASQTTATSGSPALNLTTNTMPAMTLRRRVGDLCNPVHAIFKRANFKNISDAEYAALLPVLRLTTRLLTTPELATFPHAILVAEYGHVKHPDNKELDKWSFQRKAPKLTQTDMAKYNLALSSMTDMIQFITDDKEEYHCGFCDAKDHDVTQNTHLWMGSTIHFSRKDVELHVAYAAANHSDDSLVMESCFFTAKILMHELMHAFAHARLCYLDYIPFETNQVIETGYEWEAFAFSGIINNISIKQDGCQSGAVLREWPCASITRYYKHMEYIITVVQEPPEVELWWFVGGLGNKNFSRLFSTQFWEETVPRQGVSALAPARERGYWVKVAEDGMPSLFDFCKSLESYGQAIPAGFVEDYDGEVVIELPDEQ